MCDFARHCYLKLNLGNAALRAVATRGTLPAFFDQLHIRQFLDGNAAPIFI